jgi:type IV pilus assembly protein PilQ
MNTFLRAISLLLFLGLGVGLAIFAAQRSDRRRGPSDDEQPVPSSPAADPWAVIAAEGSEGLSKPANDTNRRVARTTGLSEPQPFLPADPLPAHPLAAPPSQTPSSPTSLLPPVTTAPPSDDRREANSRLTSDLVSIIQEMIKQPRVQPASAKELVCENESSKPQARDTANGDATKAAAAKAEASPLANVRITQAPPKQKPGEIAPPGDGKGTFQIVVKNEDIRQVLAMLGEEANLNILPSANVTGNISLSLGRVSAEEALEAILKSKGLVAHREGRFIYVGTAEEFAAQEKKKDRVNTRIYRPNYVTAAEIKELVSPLITPTIGKISVTTPAKVGIGSDDTQVGGDSHAGREAVLVQDYESALLQMDRVVLELDRRPLQVAIEAMILSVKLDASHACGVDFQFLKNKGTIRLGLGSPGPSLSSVSFEDGGLKFAFLDGSTSAFVKALETIGDTDVISTPRLLTLNKQRAEILIGAELGYVSTTVTETTATQNVEFLQVGTQLRLRPFIASDGMIRMEIHPELSTGQVRVEGGVTLPDKEVTKVTTNIMVRDGSTVIIGGLMREDLTKNGRRVPFIGALPWASSLGLFGSKDETSERREILVLVTPRIVYDEELHEEGNGAACEFHRRHMIFADKMSPLGKQYLARKYFRQAQEAWACGDRERAMKLINLSIHLNPLDRAAIDFRSDLVAGIRHGEHTFVPAPRETLPPPGMWEDAELVDPPGAAPGLPPELIDQSIPAVPMDSSDKTLPAPSANPRTSTRSRPPQEAARPVGRAPRTTSQPSPDVSRRKK